MAQTPVSPPAAPQKSGAKWPWFAVGCLALLLCICLAGIAFYVIWQWPEPDRTLSNSTANGSAPASPVMALAVNLDGKTPPISLFIGDAKSDPWRLPAGAYYFEIMEANKRIHSPGRIYVPGPQDPVKLGEMLAMFPGQSLPEQEKQIQLIANMLAGVRQGELAYLSAVSEDFTVPLFTSQKDITVAQLQAITDSYASIMDDEEDTKQALSDLEARAEAARVAAPCSRACKPDQGILNSILGFFGEMHQTGNRAVEDILQAAPALSPEEKAEAFSHMQPSMIGNAETFDELMNELQNGSLNGQANRIRSFLMDEPSFVEALTGLKDSNRVLLEIAHDEGAVLVEKGAQMEVDIVKQVLQSNFPGIEKGFGYAEKITEWGDFIRKMYQDPAGGAAQFATGQATNRINQQIMQGLMDMGYSQDIAAQMAGDLSQQIVGQITKQNPELSVLATEESRKTESAAEPTDEPPVAESHTTTTPEEEACSPSDPVTMSGAFNPAYFEETGEVYGNSITLQVSPCGGDASGSGMYSARREPGYPAYAIHTYTLTGSCLSNGYCTGTATINMEIIYDDSPELNDARTWTNNSWRGAYVEGTFDGNIYFGSDIICAFTLTE